MLIVPQLALGGSEGALRFARVCVDPQFAAFHLHRATLRHGLLYTLGVLGFHRANALNAARVVPAGNAHLHNLTEAPDDQQSNMHT